jgi:hypothetical protein
MLPIIKYDNLEDGIDNFIHYTTQFLFLFIPHLVKAIQNIRFYLNKIISSNFNQHLYTHGGKCCCFTFDILHKLV